MKKLNQSGMSSLLFAMIFVIILSLLAVSFATLVRNDQQQTLDKTLSFQAQYAAETAINRKAAELTAKIASGDFSVSDSGPNCATSLDINDAASSAEAQVTCITWQNRTNEIVKDNLALKPYVTRLSTPGFTSSRVTFTWQSAASPAKTNNYGAASASLPTIDDNNVPILRVALADKNLGDVRRIYFVPSNASSGVTTDGQVVSALCNAGGVCAASVDYSTDSAWLAMMAYGGSGNVTVEARDAATGTARQLVGAQAIIDANARSQDVTKRIQARVPLSSQTWSPGFALSAGGACKDFRVEGTQGTSASGAATPCF